MVFWTSIQCRGDSFGVRHHEHNRFMNFQMKPVQIPAKTTMWCLNCPKTGTRSLVKKHDGDTMILKKHTNGFHVSMHGNVDNRLVVIMSWRSAQQNQLITIVILDFKSCCANPSISTCSMCMLTYIMWILHGCVMKHAFATWEPNHGIAKCNVQT